MGESVRESRGWKRESESRGWERESREGERVLERETKMVRDARGSGRGRERGDGSV